MVQVAPAVLALFTQANLQAPERDKSSDGTIASAAHHKQNPDSDHEPDASGWVYAGDLTDDDAHGIDCRKIAAQIVARKDRRVKYLIHEGRMVSSYPAHGYAAWEWRPYNGPNGHFHHLHVSVLKQWRNDTRTWWTALVPDHGGSKGTSAPVNIPSPRPTPSEDEMTPADWQKLEQLLDEKLRIVERAETADGKPTGHANLRAITSKLDAIATKLGIKQ